MNDSKKNKQCPSRRQDKAKSDQRVEEIIRAYQSVGTKCDPSGSYTGRPDAVFGKVPVQDADDL